MEGFFAHYYFSALYDHESNKQVNHLPISDFLEWDFKFFI